MTKKKPQRPGVVLLLALLLLAAVTASTIGIAITIASTITQSANLDNFILASFSGDSGLERSLAIVKQNRKAGTITGAINAINTANAATQTVGVSRGQFSGSATAVAEPVIIPTLRPEETISFDVFKYSAAGTLSPMSSASDPKYLWLKGTTAAGAIEVSWVLLDANGDSACTGRKFIEGKPPLSQINPGIVFGLLEQNANFLNQSGTTCTEVNPTGYRIRVRALDVDSATSTAADETIHNLVIEPYPCSSISNCAPTGVPGRIQMEFAGVTGESRSLKSASVLWQLPSTGLFNYVIFTEGDIIPN